MTVLGRTPGTRQMNRQNTTPLLIFAGIGYFNGIAQKIRRWRSMNRGIVIHSYYLGSSPFAFPWLPNFMLRNRRVARYGDPIICAIDWRMALFPFLAFINGVLSVWVTFLRVLPPGIRATDFSNANCTGDLILRIASSIAEDRD